MRRQQIAYPTPLGVDERVQRQFFATSTREEKNIPVGSCDEHIHALGHISVFVHFVLTVQSCFRRRASSQNGATERGCDDVNTLLSRYHPLTANMLSKYDYMLTVCFNGGREAGSSGAALQSRRRQHPFRDHRAYCIYLHTTLNVDYNP